MKIIDTMGILDYTQDKDHSGSSAFIEKISFGRKRTLWVELSDGRLLKFLAPKELRIRQ